MSLPPLRSLAVTTATAAVLLAGCAGAGDADEPRAFRPPATAVAEAGPTAHVYRSPTCQCCGAHVEHLRDAGFEVAVHEVDDTGAVKAELGLPDDLRSCHTTVVDGYVIEGHVPADDIERLLAERPDVSGIGLAGMPQGAPGMPGELAGPLDVRAFADGEDIGPTR